MPCPHHSPGCTGPFDGNSCASCQTTEDVDRCSVGKAACTGPFGADPCGVCKNVASQFGTRAGYQNFCAQRSARRAWLGSLQLSGVQLQKIYDDSSVLTPAQIDQKVALLADQGHVEDWCPWVRIGNVFTTVTTGNNKGWRLLVADLFATDPKRRRFAVFTGRHGTTQGTLTQADSDLYVDGVASAKHLTEDIVQKVLLDAQFKAVPDRPHVTMWDVGTTAGTTMTKTQRLAIERLHMGETVIFAWCWSLLSAYKAVGGTAQAAYPLYEMNQPYNRPIRQIVREKYGWAQTSAMDAVQPAAPKEYAQWHDAAVARKDRVLAVLPKVMATVKPVRGQYGEQDEGPLERELQPHLAAPAVHVHNH